MAFKRSEFVPHPEGVTIGTFVDWQDEVGQFGPQKRLMFDTEELMDDDRPFRVAYWITEKFNPKSNCYKFFKAMGVNVDAITDEELEALDLDDFISKRCQLVIEHKKKTDGSLQSNVANLLPLKAGRRAAVTAAPTETREPVGAAAGNGKGKWSEED